MQDGTHLLACLWENAWSLGNGDATMRSTATLTEDHAMEICADPDFLTSYALAEIGAKLKKP